MLRKFKDKNSHCIFDEKHFADEELKEAYEVKSESRVHGLMDGFSNIVQVTAVNGTNV